MCVSETEIFRATAPLCMLSHTRHTETEEIGREILCVLHTWRSKYTASVCERGEGTGFWVAPNREASLPKLN